jgi:hypothetical protein
MRKGAGNKLLPSVLFILILLLFCVFITITIKIKQARLPEQRFSYALEQPDGDENNDSFDIRELEAQIKSYWNYHSENEAEKATKIKNLNSVNGEWIAAGEYTTGIDIPEGLYLCKNLKAVKDKSSPNLVIERNGKKNVSDQDYYIFEFMVYAYLKQGDVVTVNNSTEITVDKKIVINQKSKNAFYGEGAYKIGEEISKGEYFILSMDTQTGGARVYDEQDKLMSSISRFGYITIENEMAINLDNCIMVALDKKPVVNPIQYQGTGDGKDKLIYSPGMYKIGVDIPVGKYQIKNEVFENVTERSMKGYHGNESYSPGYWNWCGIMSGNEKQAKNLGWRKIELDSYVKRNDRYVKVTDFNNNIKYEIFKGLPTVSLTEKDKGNEVNIIRCILIPE